MVSLVKKIKRGRSYYYAVQSARVDGKPRIVWQKYLGTIDAIVGRADQAQPPKPEETLIFEAGGIAALLGITQKLGLMELINEVIPKREQGPSLGHYMVLAAINRALSPCSKLSIGDWYEDTILQRIWRYSKEAFSSQRFWDHMDMMSDADIDVIQEELASRVKAVFGVSDGVLLYDTTNFYTYLASSNERSELANRGHSKAKRHDLRQLGLALLVTRDYQIPLFHRVYAGNIPDVSLFPELARELIGRHERIFKSETESTFVFDRGNVSDDGMEQLIISGCHFVAAVAANRFPELLSTPVECFEKVPDMPDIQAFTEEITVWGKKCRAVVVYTESFFTKQLAGITNNMVKCQKKLLELEKEILKWHQGKGRGQRPTINRVKTKVRDILSSQFMNEIFHIEIMEDNGLPKLKYSVDHKALDRLINERLGRTILITDHNDWIAQNVIKAYRNLAYIEDTFKNMKNRDFLHWQPAFHWTDQKLKVHGFYCFLALLLTTIARKIAAMNGIELTIPALLKELTGIREVAVIYPKGSPGYKNGCLTLSRMSSRQRKLAECLEIGNFLVG